LGPVAFLIIGLGAVSVDLFIQAVPEARVTEWYGRHRARLSLHELSPFQICNIGEGLFWILLGTGFGVSFALTRAKDKKTRAVAMLLFVVFGMSDFVEATTGAWWRPWWLLCWKALCVAGLTMMTLRYWHRKKDELRKASSGVDSCGPLDRNIL
jgi:hypothetical protein